MLDQNGLGDHSIRVKKYVYSSKYISCLEPGLLVHSYTDLFFVIV
jgi:hypothetical protein